MMSSVADRIDGGMLLSIHYDTVDGSEIPNNHLGCIKPYKSWDIYHITWWSPDFWTIPSVFWVSQVFQCGQMKLEEWAVFSADWLWPLYIEAMDFPRTYWVGKSYTPPKTNMEPENGGPLEIRRFLLETIISRFHVEFWVCRGKYDIWPHIVEIHVFRWTSLVKWINLERLGDFVEYISCRETNQWKKGEREGLGGVGPNLYAVPIFVTTLGNWMLQVDSYLFRWVGLILSHLEIYNIEIVSKRTGINW